MVLRGLSYGICDVLRATLLAALVCNVHGTLKYYGTYCIFGTGDTHIETLHAHGGPRTPLRKWNVECLDGEVMIGIRDDIDDFQRITTCWCKFMFPYKPPTNGLYPYYPNCHVRNLTTDDFCFDPRIASTTLNTFVTGFFDGEYQFRIDRRTDTDSRYKCCRVPLGYYIDYVSCYYKSTHDEFWEYYDSLRNYVVFCGDGYVMTGMARRTNPWDGEFHIDWIQCCRIGYGGSTVIRSAPTRTRAQKYERRPEAYDQVHFNQSDAFDQYRI